MNPKEKIKLIQTGNQLFNKGQIQKAQTLFIKTKYNDGIRRIADHYFYDKKDIIRALPLYMKCKNQTHIEKSYKIIAETIHKWLEQDKKTITKHHNINKNTNNNYTKITKEKYTKNKTNKSPLKKQISVEEQIKQQLLKKQKEKQ